MCERTFRVMLDLFMVSDPWPLSEAAQSEYLKLLETESNLRGYDSWVEAYHRHQPIEV